MNRREALAALTSLPTVSSIATVPASRPDDVIVVEIARRVSSMEVERLTETLTRVWPNRRIVILDEGMKIRLVPDGPPSPPIPSADRDPGWPR